MTSIIYSYFSYPVTYVPLYPYIYLIGPYPLLSIPGTLLFYSSILLELPGIKTEYNIYTFSYQYPMLDWFYCYLPPYDIYITPITRIYPLLLVTYDRENPYISYQDRT